MQNDDEELDNYDFNPSPGLDIHFSMEDDPNLDIKFPALSARACLVMFAVLLAAMVYFIYR